MATKTVSIDLEAYDRLCRARQAPTESFSKVIKRAAWPAPPHTAASLLDTIERLPMMDEEALDLLDEQQLADLPPADAWHR